MSGKNYPKRGEVYWVELDPVRGGETQKTRPGLIVSNDIGNEFSKIVMVAPITSRARNIYPFEVKAIVSGKPAIIMLNQCRALDKSRILGRIGEVNESTLDMVDEAIKIVFGIKT